MILHLHLGSGPSCGRARRPHLGSVRVTRCPERLDGGSHVSGWQGEQQAAAGLRVVEQGAEALRQIRGNMPGGGALVTGKNARPDTRIEGFARAGEQG